MERNRLKMSGRRCREALTERIWTQNGTKGICNMGRIRTLKTKCCLTLTLDVERVRRKLMSVL